MRRMYSEQELTKIIKEVSEAYISELIEEGEFDQDIADYVDAYLVEHPVDITALEGQTIAPAVVNATTSITAPSIIETMSGYSFTKSTTDEQKSYEYIYAGIVKNGNKLTFVIAVNLTRLDTITGGINLGTFVVPVALRDLLIPANIGGYDLLDVKNATFVVDSSTIKSAPVFIQKTTTGFYAGLTPSSANSLDLNQKYYCRFEATFLLSNNLAS